MEQRNKFGEFIANLRKEKQISLEQLSEGLCYPSVLSRFERGEREPEKLMQNRFLTRLGTVPENYENFMYYDDYCCWEKRQGILHHILEENITEAGKLLEEYRREYDMTNPLEYQFYLAMQAQILRYEGADKKRLATIFKGALELTVPKLEKTGLSERVLSLEELNLLLEYVHCSETGIEEYEKILDYIEKIERTMLSLAKIYPKAVYYYFLAWEKTGNSEESKAVRMLELGDRAIEILRDSNRMFYLWELFCMKERLLPMLPEHVRMQTSVQERLAECRGWRETLEEIYREYGVSIAMYEYCYLYVGSENYCIGDVIRIRRKMLGLNQKQLSVGICDARTISRLEKNISKPQREVVQCLFDRLNLSTELRRTELVTESQEAIRKYDELGMQNNNWNFVRVEELLKELKDLISMDIPSNAQAIMRNEVLSLYKQKRLSKEEYIQKMKSVLEYTVPYKAAVNLSEKYLTNEEISCLQNLTLNVGWEYKEMQECVDALIDLCEKTKYPASYAKVYEFIMSTTSSNLGNKGAYEYSNRIKKSIIMLSLKNRRIKAIDSALYGYLWNKECANKELDDPVFESAKNKELKKCIRMSDLCKISFRKKIYEEKLSDSMHKMK